MNPAESRRIGLAAIITACVFWGASFYFGKVALREVTAVEVVWWRFVLAITVLAPLVYVRARRGRPEGHPLRALKARPMRGDVPTFLLNGFLMVPLQFVLQFEGLARTSASSAALLVGTFAPFMAVAGVLIARERLSTGGWIAVALSTFGVAVMVGRPGAGRTLLGDLMVVASLLCAVGMVLVTQRLLRRYDAISVTVWSIGIGVLMLLPWLLFSGNVPTISMATPTWAAIAGLGFGSTAISFSLWNLGLRYVPASHAGIFVNLEPLIGAVLGVVLLGDVVSGGLLLGGLLILSAAVIISWPRPVVRVAA